MSGVDVFTGEGFVKSTTACFKPGNNVVVEVTWLSGHHGPGVGVGTAAMSVSSNTWSERATWFTQRPGSYWTNGGGNGATGRMFLNGLSVNGGTDSHDDLKPASDALKPGDTISLTWDSKRQLIYRVNGGKALNATPRGQKIRSALKELHLLLVLSGDTSVRVKRSEGVQSSGGGAAEEPTVTATATVEAEGGGESTEGQSQDQSHKASGIPVCVRGEDDVLHDVRNVDGQRGGLLDFYRRVAVGERERDRASAHITIADA